MAIFREVEIEWNGETFLMVPSMAVLRRIEGKLMKDGASIAAVAYHTAMNNPPIAMLSTIIGEMMRAAGARVTDDELYEEFINAGDSAWGLYNNVIAAITPEVRDRKGKTKAAEEAPTKAA